MPVSLTKRRDIQVYKQGPAQREGWGGMEGWNPVLLLALQVLRAWSLGRKVETESPFEGKVGEAPGIQGLPLLPGRASAVITGKEGRNK